MSQCMWLCMCVCVCASNPYVLMMQKCKTALRARNLSDKTFHCPYMQIFWVDKDFQISFTSDEITQTEQRIGWNERRERKKWMKESLRRYKTHSTEKPQNQRKYDDRDETINFHPRKLWRIQHLSKTTLPILFGVEHAQQSQTQRQPINLASFIHRCNSAFNASHFKFIILSEQ